MWGYQYPYQWWLKYGHSETNDEEVTNNYLPKATEPNLPEPFLGSSLKTSTDSKVATKSPLPISSMANGPDLAGPVLDEIKVCFGEGPVAGLGATRGELANLVSSLQSELGPVQEDLLLEKKIQMKMANGQNRTLVYEWINPEEGSDVYWHESDDEGFPRPLDLPDGSGHDLATFDKLKAMGTPGKMSETRLIQLQSGLQLGVEKTDDSIQSLSLKDEGHLIKCRRDAVKSFVCDCLN